MQTTRNRERNTMKKALLTFIAIGSATIATVIAFASPVSAEVIDLEPQVEIVVIPELEVDEVLCPDCDPILPPVDPDPIVTTVTICIEINPGDCDAPVSSPCPLPGLGHLDDSHEDCDFEINDVPNCTVEGLGHLQSDNEDCVEPVAMCEIDGLETLTADDENCEEIEEVVITDGGDSEEDNSTEEEAEETPESEEKVEVEETPESEEVVVEEAPETEEEAEEIAITDKAPETQEELPVTGGMHLYMIAIAALLLVLGTAALTINKLIPTNKNR